MLVFDQLKKNDPQLRAVALIVLGGLGLFLTGLWWVQIVSARDYEANLETQSFRTVRIRRCAGRSGPQRRGAGREPAHLQPLFLSRGTAQVFRSQLMRRKLAAPSELKSQARNRRIG